MLGPLQVYPRLQALAILLLQALPILPSPVGYDQLQAEVPNPPIERSSHSSTTTTNTVFNWVSPKNHTLLKHA
jgi:hypothetical protein